MGRWWPLIVAGVVLLVAAFAPAYPLLGAQATPGASCGTFPNQSAAQNAYRENPIGLRRLDPEGTGVACAALPCPCDRDGVRPVDVSRALLTQAEMPPGWAAGAVPTDDGTSTLCPTDPLSANPSVEEDGSLRAGFSRGPLGPWLCQLVPPAVLGSGVFVMTALRDVLAPRTYEETNRDGLVTEWRISPLAFPPLGDEVAAARVDARNSRFVLQGDLVLLRRGDIVTVLVHLAGGIGDVRIDTAETLRIAQLVDARLRE